MKKSHIGKRKLLLIILLTTLLILFLSACFKLGEEPSINAEFTLTREEIPFFGISEYAFSVDVKGVKDAAVVEFDNGMPSIALNGDKAESRFFANIGTEEVTLVVRDSRGVELLKKTIALEKTVSQFREAALGVRTGFYLFDDPDLIFYSVDCLLGLKLSEKSELLDAIDDGLGAYIVVDIPGFVRIYDFNEYPYGDMPLTEGTLDTLGLPHFAKGFGRDDLVSVLSGKNLYSLTVSWNAGGYVSVNPNCELYEEGTEVTLTAIPEEGKAFAGWSGDVESSSSELLIFMNTNFALLASFSEEAYTVAFTVADQDGPIEIASVELDGEVRQTDSQGSAVFTDVTAGEKPYTVRKDGYENSTGSVNVDADKNVNVFLEKKTYTLATTVIGQGSVVRDPDREKYTHGEVVKLTAVPSTGWNFNCWSGDYEGSEDTIDLLLDSDKNVIVWFSEKRYFVEAIAEPLEGGLVTGDGSYGHGEEVVLVAEANDCYMFSGWYEDGLLVSETSEYRFQVTDERRLEARFEMAILMKDFRFVADIFIFGSQYEVNLLVNNKITRVEFRYSEDSGVPPVPGEAFPDENGEVYLSAFLTNPAATSILIVCYAGENIVSICEAQLSKENLAEFDLTFNVIDEEGPVFGANIVFNGEARETDALGKAFFACVTAGTKAYTVSKSGYENSTGSVNVDSDKSVNVVLQKKTYTLSTNTVGQGSVSKNPDKSTYAHGEIVQLTAIPSTGWNFTGWSGDLSGTANPANITMDSNKTVTATFTIKKYTIAASANPPAGGSVSGGGNYTHGDTVDLVATPNEGYELMNWTENGVQVSANATYSFTATANRTLVANFRLKTYTITATAGAGGSINPAGNVNVTHGSSQSFTIIPNASYDIGDVKVEGVSVGAVSSYTFNNVTANHTIAATFKLKTYILTTNAVGQGTVTKNPNRPTYDHGEEVELTATPDEGWNFAGWSGDLSGTANPANITMDSNKTVTATFTIKKYTIAVSANPPAGGAITGAGSYNHGDAVNLVATPNEGYEFVNWTENGVQVSANATYSFTATANRTLVANFRLKTYTITATAGAGGSINPAGNVNVTHGSSQSFTIIPNASYDIGDVKVEGVSVGAVSSYTFNNVTANHTIAATFKLKTYILTTNAVGQGTVTKNPNRPTYDHGEEVELTATPDEGWNFAGWSGDLSGTANPANITMDSNKTVTATFTIKKYTIAVSANPPAGGSVSGGGNYTHGDTVNLVATPNEGYEFVNWTENGVQVSADTTYSFTATSNRTLVANFRLKTYTITATAGAGGSINPAGNVNVTHGLNQSFTITPDTGYDIEDVKVDGVSVGAVSTYNFTNVTANHTIAATFKLKTYTLTTNAVGQGTVTKNPNRPTYDHGEEVQLTANPDEGWKFAGWSGDLSGSANPANLTMNGNKTVTADFVRVYTVTFNVSDNQGAVVQGANVAFNGENRSTDAQGKAVFTNVQSGTRSYTISKTGYNNATGSVNVDVDKTVNVTLTKKTYTIAVSANPTAGGTAAGGGVYTHGDTVNLSATPKEGYEFINWTENGAQVSASSTYSFTATGNRTLVANFSIQQEVGGFKVANSWGIGGWEKVPDGFLYITYEAMKQNKVLCFVVDPKDNYEPRAIAVFKISHSVRDDCYVYVGVGNPSSPSREKRFDDFFYRGGPWPFPNNKMVLDITELLPFNNETLYLKVYDTKTGSTGTIEFFSVEIYDNYPSGVPSSVFTSTQTPKNTVNNSYVNVQIPGVTVSTASNYDLSSNAGGLSKRLLEGMKETMGVYEEGRDYNEIINGYGTGLRPPSVEEWEEIANSWYEMEAFGLQETLPVSLDHSSSIHFPPIGNQGNEGSCVAFSVGYYTATFYEACDRNWDLSGAQWVGGYYGAPTASYQDRILSPDFIYHQINDGYDQGSAYQDAMKLISSTGVSSWKEMPYNPNDSKTWPSESAWREAPRYRSHTNVMRVLRVENDQDIQTLKSYINAGYLVSISIDAYKYANLSPSDVWNSTNYTNPNTNHANTIVGYDDNMGSQ